MAQLGLFGAPPPEVAPADVAPELAAIAARLPAELRMGTSTWSFPGWRGIVYAGEHTGDVLARAGLSAYAAHPLLRSVGVDRTHYGPVGPDVFAGWAASVPAHFRFLVKAHELCTLAVVPTHARYGSKRGLENPLFFDAAYARDVVVGPYVEGLGDRAGVLVFQLAQQPIGALGGSPRRFAERLYRFLRDLPKGPRYAVEIRNSPLLTADYAAALRHGGAVHCFTVVPAMPAPDVQRTVVGSQPALVVRWNQTALYDYEGARAAYAPFDRIVDPDPPSRRAIATLIEEAERLHLPSWLIVNNKAEGSAPLSIELLAREVARRLAGAPSAAESKMAAVTEPASDDELEAQRKAERKADSKAAGIFVYSRTGVGLLQVALLPILTRLCDKLEVAYVQALVVLYVGAVGVGSLGLPDAVFYFLGRTPERGAAIVRQTSALLLLAAGPVVAVVFVAGIHMSDHELRLIPALPWLALMLVLELPTQPAINQLLATGYPRAAASLYVGFELARTFAILIPVILGLPLSWIPIFMAGTGFLRLLAHVIALRRVFPLPAGEVWRTRSELWAIFAFAFPAGLAGMVGKLNPVIDKYVVTVMLGAEELALYAAAAIELPLITAIPFAIGAVMQVRYVRLYSTGQTEQLRSLWYSTVEKTALIVVPLTTLFLVIADDLVVLLATRDYADAATPFRIFTLIMLHRVAAYGPMLQAVGRIRMLIVTSSIIVLTNLVLTVPLTYAVGYNGAAIATAVAYMPAWAVSLYFIGQAWGSGIRSALPWRFYGKTLAVALSTGAAVFAAMTQVGGGALARIGMATAAFAAIFLVAGRIVGVVTRGDMAYLRSWLSFGAIK